MTQLSTLADTLDEWVACQRSWMYLESIFGAEDIQKQLPAESQQFAIVDRSFKVIFLVSSHLSLYFLKEIMLRTESDPLVLRCLDPLDNGQSILSVFRSSNASLDSIQRSLEDYLETKRMAFPRFYFLSNDELLEVLSQSRDPLAIQPHMGKCFDAIKALKFQESKRGLEVKGFCDPSGEEVLLSHPVKAEGLVETWLLQFQQGMRETLYDQAKLALAMYPPSEQEAIDRAEWLWSSIAQVIIVVDQIVWTAMVGSAIAAVEAGSNPLAVAEFLRFTLKQIDGMVALVRAPLDRQRRTLLGALLTIDVHARDVVRALERGKVNSISDFDWTKQLRYYWDTKDDDIYTRQTNASFRYGYEYLGNGPWLVITPLTDICYMTLTGALHMRLGGAPSGPAGTGKTETTKDLAKALAVYCVVFNCSDGLDYKIMGRFFSGLAQQGAWACFDEFNRIDIEVLSVIAQQVLCIQQAILRTAMDFDFEGRVIPLNTAFGVFITMNPGYAGRTELPDNLKSLFRPVAMMVPDYRLIAEIMLFSEGFQNALPLSNKMAQLYALSSEQLSKQDHYDFGMRAVKSVLVAAGQLKRKEPETNEDLLLIRAMRDSNVPKFLEQDLPLFGGILKDLFPGVVVPYVDYGKLQQAVERALVTTRLQKVPALITKVIQIHETQLVRHGMMVVGETGSGKSTAVGILATALGQLYDEKEHDRDGFYKHIDRFILNPKAITAGELYGEFNELTAEWRDGIVPKLVRDCVNAANESSERRQWIIFDGPVDAVWIENMNTVLDDNKTLCLANSERIKLPQSLHMVFEVQDLKVASPATVSRCGMVYMEQVHVGGVALIHSWGNTELMSVGGEKNVVSPSAAKTLVGLIEAHLPLAVEFARQGCNERIPTSTNQMVVSLLHLLSSSLRGVEDAELVSDLDAMLALLIWSLVWSVGGNLADDSRSDFSEWLATRFGSVISPKYSPILDDPYGCYIDLKSREVKSWHTLIPEFVYDSHQPYFDILVPTVETVRHRYLLDTLVQNGRNVLLVGETGVGKSVVVNSFLFDKSSEGLAVSYVMGCSAQTKPSNLREVLESKLEKKRKALLGPPIGKKMFLFIDDINMPALETYGAQPSNELLRQVLDQGGFYDTQRLFFKHVQEVVVLAACAPPGGGRNELSPRLLRHFHKLWLTTLSTVSLSRVFTSIARGFLSQGAPHLAETASSIVQASINIYTRIQKELLPTPLKAHYTFNLRDLSKVFQGILMMDPALHFNRESLLLLWCHECSRVFRDRLIDNADRDWYNKVVLEQLQGLLDVPLWTSDTFNDVLFGNFDSKGNKNYCLMDFASTLNSLTSYLEDYNIMSTSRMDLVFFKDAVHHIARISRILSQPRGNALLVGVGGSGRRSLTKMAAFIAEYKCCSIEITRGFGINEWHENLKEVLMNAGAKAQPTVFLFSDTQIVVETFLEDLNNILNSGEVPNLYESDEQEKIISAVRPLAVSAGKGSAREAVFLHFVSLIRANLHVVLCMSPIGSSFRNRCRMFPSLVNCCTIDWFSAWPQDALFSVAKRTFEFHTDLNIGPHLDKLASLCCVLHSTVEDETVRFAKELRRFNYTTPTSYLELISLYIELLRKQQTKLRSNESRYGGGLAKLQETEEMVTKLEQTLMEMRPVLERASNDTAELLHQVSADQAEADKQAAVVQEDVDVANRVAAEVAVIKDDCQTDLDEAMPAYEAAVEALKTLDKKSLQEMKAFTNPPEMVKFTMEAVCILFDRPADWGEAKKLLSQMDFMDRLKDFDKDNINPKIIKKLQKYYSDPRFMPEEVRKISAAAMSLCLWVRAMVSYDRVAKSIEPKKIALKEAEQHLAETLLELESKQEGLRLVQERVESLQITLRQTEERKAELEAQAERAKMQLERAGRLIGGLAGEKKRWKQSLSQLRDELTNLVGNMVLAAGFVAYLGPFTSSYRHRIVGSWEQACRDIHLPCGSFSLIHSLADPVTVRQWQLNSLPADEFSIENGVLTTVGRRWPLMIDPQGQANRWIRSWFADLNLQIIKLTERDYLRTLENGVRYGAPVLLENVGELLDPSLEPILLKQIFRKAGQNLIRLGDTDVPYSDDFRFFITTKLSNPHYMPEVAVKVTLINFTVTMTGLEDQLLVDVVKNERPDLEQRRDALVVSIAADQKQLRDLEEQILSMLAAASGNILDDEALIETMALSQKTSVKIGTRLKESEITTFEINSIREQYRIVATRGSVIYFVVAALNLVDPMYSYSMAFYQSLVLQRLQKTEKCSELEDRLKLLREDLTRSIYFNVCRGVFEKDKLLFAFLIAVHIDIAAKIVSNEEWVVYLVGLSPNAEMLQEKPFPSELTGSNLQMRQWNCITALEIQLPAIFAGLGVAIKMNFDDWQPFFSRDDPQNVRLPQPWEDKLDSFKKLLIIRILREEKLVFAVRHFVNIRLGQEFTEAPVFDLQSAFEDSSAVTPMIFILSPGADPTDYLFQLAEGQGKMSGLRVISLGQGQGPIAERVVEASSRSGDWVCLQNCHLALSWLSKLEQIIEKMQASPELIHKDFRLWCTSMPTSSFPVPILQNGIKITNEPPRGLRANLMRTFLDMNDEDYEVSSNPNVFKRLALATAFFNALILERRKFGAVGWNIPYDWMNSDLKAAMTQVRMYVEESNTVPWRTLNVVVADITYGGRVTDVWDKRTISSLLRKFFVPDLLGDGFYFTDDENYPAVAEINLTSMREYIKTLPVEDLPSVFGLHSNAAITLQQKESRSLIATVLACSENGGQVGGGSEGGDAKVRDSVAKFQDRLPHLLDVRSSHPDNFVQDKQGMISSLGVFLTQEVVRFNALIAIITSTLRELVKAMKGEVVMSSELEDMYACFVFQKVPAAWERVGYPCLKPLASWIEDFLLRIKFFDEWLRSGPPVAYWLPGFFFPQGFMTALKQVYSRDNRVAVDTLRIGCEVTSRGHSEMFSPPQFGAYIFGLFMEGGRYDRSEGVLSDSVPGVLFDSMPCIWLKPIIAAEYNPVNAYDCPLYKTSTRAGTLSTTGHSTNFVVSLPIPRDVGTSEDYWIRRGCAMLCMLDD